MCCMLYVNRLDLPMMYVLYFVNHFICLHFFTIGRFYIVFIVRKSKYIYSRVEQNKTNCKLETINQRSENL